MDDREQAAVNRMKANVDRVVAHLRQVAAQIERDTERSLRGFQEGSGFGPHTYGEVAAEVVHTATWGLANTNLSNVVHSASDADKIRADLAAAQVPAPRDEMPLTNQKTGAVNALSAMVQTAQGWAEGSHESQVSMGHEDVKPVESQEFVLADIGNMVNDAARQVGVAPVWVQS